MTASPRLAPSQVAFVLAALVTGCVIPESVGIGTVDSTAHDESTTDPSEDGMPPGATSAASTTGPASTGDPGSSSGPASTGASESTGMLFLQMTDGGTADPECSPWTQDCPPGQKCVPFATEGSDAWDSARCSPIVADPDPVGEPCTVEKSGTSGLDTCVAGAMCWEVDPETLEGICVGLCTGDEAVPLCEQEGTVCIIANDGALPICLPTCDPVLQDCTPGHTCYPFDDVFVCAPDDPNAMGGAGESCEAIAVCNPGLLCVQPELVPDCPSDVACCTPFCNVTDPMPPCLPGQACTPYYEPGMAPEGFEDVGTCTLPT
jgi:hypothetical protein